MATHNTRHYRILSQFNPIKSPYSTCVLLATPIFLMITLIFGKGKGRFIRVLVMKKYRASGGKTPPILSLGTCLR